MSTKSKRHIHKYHRVIIAGTSVWACALGDCNHYMPKHMESIVPGKNSYCWECDSQMILDSINMSEDRPRCTNCRLGINPESIESIIGGVK
jgi:hypothetical protein